MTNPQPAPRPAQPDSQDCETPTRRGLFGRIVGCVAAAVVASADKPKSPNLLLSGQRFGKTSPRIEQFEEWTRLIGGGYADWPSLAKSTKNYEIFYYPKRDAR